MLCANTRRYGLCRPCPAAGSSSGVCRFQLPPYFRSFSCPTPRTAFLFSSGFFSFVPHLLRDTRPTPFYSIFPSLVTCILLLIFFVSFLSNFLLYIFMTVRPAIRHALVTDATSWMGIFSLFRCSLRIASDGITALDTSAATNGKKV